MLKALANEFHEFSQVGTSSPVDKPFLGEVGVPPSEALSRLRATFDPPTSRAIASLAMRLQNILFEQSDEVIGPNDPVRVYPAMYTNDGSLQEFARFAERIFESADEGNPLPKKHVTDFLFAWTDKLATDIDRRSRGASTSESLVLSRWSTEIRAAAYEFQDAVERAGLTEDIRESRDQARQAAGDTGAAVLGGHYNHIANEESITAITWTAVSLGALIAVLCIGIYAINHPGSSGDWNATLFHLALTLPVVGIAAFSARLARHHRLLARWAKTAAVQINSVGAFAQQIPSAEGREQLILHLGQTVFGPPVFADESKTENVSGIPPGLIELLKEVVKRDIPK